MSRSKKPLVSVVVPLYNNGAYIDSCLNSLRDQTLKNIEIIVINNGSTDNGCEVVMKHVVIDKRIRFYSIDKKGTSNARNYGIKKAKGEYVGFVDSDDTVKKNMFEILYCNAHKYNSDISVCSIEKVYNGEQCGIIGNSVASGVYKEKDIQKFLLEQVVSNEKLEDGIIKSVCSKIFLKEFIKKNDLQFEERILFGEDAFFTIASFFCAANIYINSDFYGYKYSFNPNSVTNNYVSHLESMLSIYEKRVEAILIMNNQDTSQISRLRVKNAMSLVANIGKKSNLSLIEKIDELKNICKNPNLKKSFKDIDEKKLSLKRRILYRSIKDERLLFLYVLSKLNNIKVKRK